MTHENLLAEMTGLGHFSIYHTQTGPTLHFSIYHTQTGPTLHDSYGPRFSTAGLKSISGIAIIKCHSDLEMALHTDQNGQMIFDKSCFFQVENPLRKFSSK